MSNQIKYLFLSFFLFFVSYISIQHVNAYSRDTSTVSKEINCTYNSTISSNASTQAEYNSFLSNRGIPTSITRDGHTYYYANHSVAESNCLLVYGTSSDVRWSDNNADASGQKRYLGYSSTPTPVGSYLYRLGVLYYPISNLKYIPYCPYGCSDWTNTSPLVKYPWLGKSGSPHIHIYNYDNPADDITFTSGMSACGQVPTVREWVTQESRSCIPTNHIPYPENGWTSDTDWEQQLDAAIDTYNHSPNFHGGFNLTNSRLGYKLDGAHLKYHAAPVMEATEYSYGMFELYFWSVNSNIYWYSSFAIPSEKCLIACGEPEDASLSLSFDTSHQWLDTERLYGNVKVTSNMSSKILIPCSTTGTNNSSKCNSSSSYTKGYITVKNRTTGATPFTKEIQSFKCTDGTTCNSDWATSGITTTTSSANRSVDLRGENIYLTPGNYEICASIPQYDNETDYSNNSSCKDFTVITKQNAKVKISGPATIIQQENITHSIKITNSTAGPISGTLSIKVSRWNGSNWVPATNLSKTYTSIAKNGTVEYDLIKDALKYNLGKYKIEASITKYPVEVDYATPLQSSDNYDSMEFTVLPFVPDNVNCKELKVDYTKVIGTGPNITKLCVGQLPKFPSTVIEGGQGTFFYIGYRLFPLPLPAYQVTNLDSKGLYQSYSMTEPHSALGACDPKITNDTKCELIDPFLYYPNSIDNKASIKGPFKAGPHSYYHYMYRGRMFPKQVEFNFTIKDPSDGVIDASGDVVFKIDSSCYRTDALDIKDECRQIDFYIPTASTMPTTLTVDTTGADGRTQVKMPEDSKKIQFKNPGVHEFNLQVTEDQIYLYQEDDGAEWQGNGLTPHAALTSPRPDGGTIAAGTNAVNTYTTQNGARGEKQWVIRDDFLNHCYTTADAFGNAVGSQQCFHDHDKAFHYWIFNWSAVKNYGTLR